MAIIAPTSLNSRRNSVPSLMIFGSKLKLGEIEETHLGFVAFSKSNPGLKLKASREHPGLTQELESKKLERVGETEYGCELFDDLKQRFLSFKNDNYLKNIEHFENLAKAQAPKLLVIACGDSRVCPSNILGFQPGEAFVVRNVANLVPPFESGPSETKAALEFAINALEVKNILIIGHSCCGGIRALMSMQDNDESSSFIRNWVVVGKKASLRAKATASNLSFDQQCRHCEKESVNQSLLNLFTYPWIEEKVMRGLLSVHGGYYDFTECTFEKWSLEYRASNVKDQSSFIVKNRSFWC